MLRFSRYIKIIVAASVVVMLASYRSPDLEIGEKIDEYKGVTVHYNGAKYTRTFGRHISPNGYNLGLKYQCVEFVKRFYYEVYNHQMPNAFGNAKTFFDKALPDKAFNKGRAMMQYRNVRTYKPQPNDLLIYDGYDGNPYGHVAIITKVGEDYIEVVQQNIGKQARIRIPLVNFMDYWTIADYNILGWLRLE